jgi:hypothetical protein
MGKIPAVLLNRRLRFGGASRWFKSGGSFGKSRIRGSISNCNHVFTSSGSLTAR